MSLSVRHRLSIAALPGLLLIGAIVLLQRHGGGLRSRAASIRVGMTREQVEERLGPPALDLHRVGGRGTAMAWVDQMWQVDVQFGPDGRAARVGCTPSDSFLRRTVGRVLPLPK